ncbi:MAG: glycosyltransferase [Bacteroidota bacterium]
MSAPLRVGVYLADQNPHRDRSLGISTVTQSILDGLSTVPDLDLTAWTSTSAIRPTAPVRTRSMPLRTDRALPRLLADTFHPWLIPTRPDVWFYPKGYLSLIARPTRPALLLVHDTILDFYHRTYPEERSVASYRYWLQVLERSLRRADRIATVSETSKRQMQDFADRRGFQLPAIDVVYAACHYEHLGPTYDTKQDYVLHLASDASHKRTRPLLDCWRQGIAEGRDLPRLVLIGALSPELDAYARATPHVEVLARQPEESFIAYYQNALAVVVPSQIEGFGLPVLEGYALGTPVCYTRGTSMEEVVGSLTDVGGFDLDDPASLWSALDDALRLDTTEIDTVRTALLERFSNERLRNRITGALHRTAGVRSRQTAFFSEPHRERSIRFGLTAESGFGRGPMQV